MIKKFYHSAVVFLLLFFILPGNSACWAHDNCCHVEKSSSCCAEETSCHEKPTNKKENFPEKKSACGCSMLASTAFLSSPTVLAEPLQTFLIEDSEAVEYRSLHWKNHPSASWKPPKII